MKIIKAGKIITLKGNEILENKYIVVEDGIIQDITTSKPSVGEFIHAEKLVVIPSFIDPATQIGLAEEGAGFNYYDSDEATFPSLPHLRSLDAFYPKDLGIKDAAKGGVSYFVSSPGDSAVFSGLEGIFASMGITADDMVRVFPSALKLNMNYSSRIRWRSEGKYPSTKMGILALIREKFEKAKNYEKKKEKEKDLEMEALLKVLRKEIPIKISVNTRDEIEKAIELKREYDINIILQEAEDSFQVADLLKKEEIPVIAGPYFIAGRLYHQRNHYAKNLYPLYEKGVIFALTTLHPVVPVHLLYHQSALLVKVGIPELDALRSISTNPANILSLEREAGTIEKGKKANLVFLSDEPFTKESDVVGHMLEGEMVWKNF
ncbi:MAG: amidohydrolase family protein [candidate division WOR-3 bacterium]